MGLKKEFKKSDIKRIRNLIQGKYTDKTKLQVGYNKSSQEHKEGDIWEENGKKWTISNGIRIRVSKRKEMKDKISPLFCPKCNKPLKNKYDKQMFKLHNMCFDCVIKYEDELKLKGEYKKYEREQILKSYETLLNDLENGFEDWIKDEENKKFFLENGEVEDWEGNLERIKNETRQYILKLKREIKEELNK